MTLPEERRCARCGHDNERIPDTSVYGHRWFDGGTGPCLAWIPEPPKKAGYCNCPAFVPERTAGAVLPSPSATEAKD